MPKLGEVMEEGTVTSWYKQEGDAVTQGEPIMEVETDKAVMDVEAAMSGVVTKILVAAGETVPVHTPLALIE